MGTTPLRYVALTLLALLAPACSPFDEPSPWRPVADGPLSPRAYATGVWTGEEVLIVGGRDADLCPPSAGCLPPDDPPLADGAAFDPATGSWRRIADAPIPFDFARTAVVGGTVYFHVLADQPGGESAVFAYDVDGDRWARVPAGPDERYDLVAARDRVVAYASSYMPGRAPDLVLGAGGWRPLPLDPLRPSASRAAAWGGDDLVVFSQPRPADPTQPTSSPTQAAAYSFDTGRWRRLPDAPMIGLWPWVRVGDVLVNPSLATSQGVDPQHAEGAILDLARERWSPLPPTPFEQGEATFAGGVYAGAQSQMSLGGGWVLDLAERRWFEVPRHDHAGDGYVDGETVVSAGAQTFAFGGVRWDGVPGTVLGDMHVVSLDELARE